MSQASTLFFNGTQSSTPYWVNYPPNVPKYPSSQEMFRFERPERFTAKVGRESSQCLKSSRDWFLSRQYLPTPSQVKSHWTDKWYDSGYPTLRREELPKIADRHEPCSQPWMYNVGTSAVKTWDKQGKDWPINQKFVPRGKPPGETQRARGMNRLSIPRDEKLYPFSNYMTSTYRRPVYSVFGPMQREPTYGVTHQHNRHGNMPFEDYY